MVVLVAVGAGLAAAISGGVFDSDSGARVATGPSGEAPVPPVAPRRYEWPQSNRIPAVALGRSVLLRSQDESRVRVTALGVVDPVACGSYSLRPKRGRRWVGVRASRSAAA